MHKYLRTIGFSQLESIDMLEQILQDVENNCDRKKIVEKENHRMFGELSKDYGYNCGITVCGEYDREGNFHREYYYPYFRGQGGFSFSDLLIERHAYNESFGGAYDDFNIGMTLVFYLLDPAEYIKQSQQHMGYLPSGRLAFSALSDDGKILFPIKKSGKEQEASASTAEKRSSMFSAVQRGDQETVESLTMEDIDLYAKLTKRIRKEDLYSVIHTSFIPCGLECEQYTIIGDIEETAVSRNSCTGERLHQMRVVTNDIPVEVCINEEDLLGIPEPGMRFKGKIWLQGAVEGLSDVLTG